MGGERDDAHGGALVSTDHLTMDQLLILRAELKQRMKDKARAAAKAQSEHDAVSKEIKRRRRLERAAAAGKVGL